MVELTKINDEVIMINPNQIEYIEVIPESKIIMMNNRYHIVKETKEEIYDKVVKFRNECINRTFSWED